MATDTPIPIKTSRGGDTPFSGEHVQQTGNEKGTEDGE